MEQVCHRIPKITSLRTVGPLLITLPLPEFGGNRGRNVATPTPLNSQSGAHVLIRPALEQQGLPYLCRLVPGYRDFIDFQSRAERGGHTVSSATTQHMTPREFIELKLGVTAVAIAFRTLPVGNI